MAKEFLTLPEVAERYRVSINTIKRLVAEGKITTPKRVGVQLRFSMEGLAAWEKSTSANGGEAS